MDMNKDQITRTLAYIENVCSEEIVRSVFGRLGENCYRCRKRHEWVDTFGHDIRKMINWIATNASPYWKKLEFGADQRSLLLTGKTVTACACAYLDHEQPQKALCRYCCKRFQEMLWGDLLGKAVTVEITKAFLLGDDRCDTTIHILE